MKKFSFWDREWQANVMNPMNLTYTEEKIGEHNIAQLKRKIQTIHQ